MVAASYRVSAADVKFSNAPQAELRALREARDGRLVGDLDAATSVNQRLSAQLRALQEGNSELEKAAYDAEALRAHIERETAGARALQHILEHEPCLALHRSLT